jgi:death on curing protein
MSAFIWINQRIIMAVHDEQLAEHGGSTGLRDEGLLQSALGRPQNAAAYNDNADIYTLAAAYAYALAKNHPFIDGNKRTAAVAMELFIEINGYKLTSTNVEGVIMMLKLAGGDMSEEELITWLRANVEVVQPSGQ